MPPPPARVQVVAREFGFALSRPVVRAGTVVIELVDFGMDPHDLELQREGVADVQVLGGVTPHNHARFVVTLAPGRYRLFCGIGDHRSRGMETTLVVRGVRRGP